MRADVSPLPDPPMQDLPGPTAASADESPSAEVLLAACEAMAMLIRREFSGDGCPIADDVATFTEATPEQIAAVEALDAYWAA